MGRVVPRRRVQRLKAQVSRGARKRQRHGSGKLSDQVVSSKQAVIYHRLVRHFFMWLQAMQFQIGSSVTDFDLQVVSFIEYEWHEGGSRSDIGCLLSGLHHFIPALRGSLRGSWCLHTAWGKIEMPQRATPIPKAIVRGLAALAWRWGYWDVCLVILLQFEVFLRTGEVAGILRHQFTISQGGLRAVLALPHTKGSARSGASESVVLDDAWLIRKLSCYLSNFRPGDRMLQRSIQHLRKIWKALVEAAGLDPAQIRMYGLRRGGATEHFLQCGRLDLTMLKGRWATPRVARIYINEGLTALNDMQLTSEDKLRFSQWSAVLQELPG